MVEIRLAKPGDCKKCAELSRIEELRPAGSDFISEGYFRIFIDKDEMFFVAEDKGVIKAYWDIIFDISEVKKIYPKKKFDSAKFYGLVQNTGFEFLVDLHYSMQRHLYNKLEDLEVDRSKLKMRISYASNGIEAAIEHDGKFYISSEASKNLAIVDACYIQFTSE